MMNRQRWLAVAVIALLGGRVPAVAPGGSVVATGHEPPPWSVWWERNGPLLLPAKAGFPKRVGTRLAAARDLSALGRLGAGGAAELIRLGASRRADGLFALFDAVDEESTLGTAAVLGLGGHGGPAVIGHLRALLEDRPAGRALAGNPRRPVPERLRVAAAVALGLTRHPRAAVPLRDLLRDGRGPEALAAAAVVGLSLAADPEDLPLLLALVEPARAAPAAVREAAAAALGRQEALGLEGRRTLTALLERDPGGAGRGAAVALWIEGTESDDEDQVLARAAAGSPDALTRVLALIALAGRGDARALDVIDGRVRSGLAGGYDVLALGLFGRAAPASRWACADRLRAPWISADTAPVIQAERLLFASTARARPPRSRDLAALAGANAVFDEVPDLQDILALVATAFGN